MTPVQTLRTAALISASLSALAFAACNKSGAAQNGAYVSVASDTSAPTSVQSLPPSNEYQAVADAPPPAIPAYDQPPIPAPGYMWTPGYWDWSTDGGDYYWVPGTWIEPPGAGLFWTPGYWRYYNGRYLFSNGYWGPQVGFYGGVNYGFGYEGSGYYGGRWQGSQFYYNSQVNNIGGRPIAAVYNQSVPNNSNRASYNGGPGGLRTAPAQAQIQAAQARHLSPTRAQLAEVQSARAEPQLRASVNQGKPSIAAIPRPTEFRAAAAAAGVPTAPTPTARTSVRPAIAAPKLTPRPEPAASHPTNPLAASRSGEGRFAGEGREAPIQPVARPAPSELRLQTEPRPEPQIRAPVVSAPQAHALAPRPAGPPAAEERRPGGDPR